MNEFNGGLLENQKALPVTEELLETLAAVGQARVTDDGRYAAQLLETRRQLIQWPADPPVDNQRRHLI